MPNLEQIKILELFFCYYNFAIPILIPNFQ